jgi:hypothetical protein
MSLAFVRKIRNWALQLACCAALLAYVFHSSLNAHLHIDKYGDETLAKITRWSPKGDKIWSLHKLALTWTDANGELRTAHRVLVPSALAQQIIVDDRLIVSEILIKYVVAEPAMAPMFAGVLQQELAGDRELIAICTAATLAGAMLAAACIFLLRRRVPA